MEYYFGIGILNSKSNTRFPAVTTGQLVWRVVESSLNMLSGKRKRWTEDINKTKTKSLPQRENPTLSSKIENTNLELDGPWHQLHKNSRSITSGRKKIGRKYPSETWKWRKRSKRRKVMILHPKKRESQGMPKAHSVFSLKIALHYIDRCSWTRNSLRNIYK